MPLFFLLSGVASYYSLNNRKPHGYIVERVRRLFIPLIFGITVIIPPMIYIERLGEPGFNMSYLEFYPHFYECCYPEGNFKPAHLWFIAYLLAYSVVLLPIMLFLKSDTGDRILSKAAGILKVPFGILLLGLPLALNESLLHGKWEGGHNLVNDWLNNIAYSTVFIYGYLFCMKGEFWKSIEKYWKLSLCLGIITMSIMFTNNYSDFFPDNIYFNEVFQAILGLNIWFWLVAILGAGRKYLNFNNPILEYANGLSYPFLIFHQTLTVFVAYYVLKWNTGIFVKFLVISTVSLIMGVAVYDILIRRTNFTRFLFGMKPVQKEGPSK